MPSSSQTSASPTSISGNSPRLAADVGIVRHHCRTLLVGHEVHAVKGQQPLDEQQDALAVHHAVGLEGRRPRKLPRHVDAAFAEQLRHHRLGRHVTELAHALRQRQARDGIGERELIAQHALFDAHESRGRQPQGPAPLSQLQGDTAVDHRVDVDILAAYDDDARIAHARHRLVDGQPIDVPGRVVDDKGGMDFHRN